MFKHGKLKWALALAVPAIAALTLAVSASATPPPKLSFDASSDGASAGWSRGNRSPIELTLGSSAGSFAEITINRIEGTALSTLAEPSFTTDNYGAGSPRYYITLSNGDSLWGYPSNSGLNGTDMAWAINNGPTYESWSAVQSAEDGATVTGAYVIADRDQAAGTTDQITNLTFGSTTFN
jgi:hypothetical protein